MTSNATVQLLRDIKSLLEKTAPQVDEAGDKIDKFGNKVNAMGVAITRANKRTAIFRATLKDLSERASPKKFELFNPRALMAYRRQGGTVLEYFAEFLTNSAEDIRILGFEAVKFRRFFFGFIPGSFAVLNKIALTFQFIGGTLRTLFPKAKKELKDTTKEASKFSKAMDKITSTLGRGKDLVKKQFSVNNLKKVTDALGKRRQKTREGENLTEDFFQPMLKRLGEAKSFLDGAMFKSSLKLKSFGKKTTGVIKEQFSAMRKNSRLIPILDEQGFKTGRFRDEKTGRFAKKEVTPLAKLQFLILTKLKDIKFGRRIKSMSTSIMAIGRKVTMFFLGFLAFITGLFLLLKLIGPAIKRVFENLTVVKDVLMFGLGIVMEGVMSIWSGLQGLWKVVFGGGSIIDFINALVDLGVGVLQVAVGLLISLIGPLFTLLGSLVFELGKEVISKIKQIGNKGKLALLIGGVLAFIAWWYTAPVWLVALIGFVVFKAVSLVLKSGPKAVWDAFLKINFVKLIVDTAVKVLDMILSKISDIPVIGGLVGRATGGIVGVGETTLVGERGPELVKLPAGSRVFTNRQTKGMMGSSTVNNFNITINAKDTSREEMRRVADEIGRMVSTKINRRSSFRNSI